MGRPIPPHTVIISTGKYFYRGHSDAFNELQDKQIIYSCRQISVFPTIIWPSYINFRYTHTQCLYRKLNFTFMWPCIVTNFFLIKTTDELIKKKGWTCRKTVIKPARHIPVPNVQWKTPDDGQRNCLKHVVFDKINLRN